MIIVETNCETQEVIERPMTAEELAQWEQDKRDEQERQRLEIERQEKRSALLERIGITEEEAKLLLR